MEPSVSDAIALTYSSDAPSIIPVVDLIAAIHRMAHEGRWQVKAFHIAQYPMSFHWACFTVRQQTFYLIIEAHGHAAALSSEAPQYWNLQFFNDLDVMDAALKSDTPFTLLTTKALTAAPSAADHQFVGALSPHHLYSIKYWKPETVADIIFNWWD